MARFFAFSLLIILINFFVSFQITSPIIFNFQPTVSDLSTDRKRQTEQQLDLTPPKAEISGKFSETY